MTTQERIAAYTSLVEQIEAALKKMDKQMETLVENYQRLVILYDSVSTDLEKLIVSHPSGNTLVENLT